MGHERHPPRRTIVHDELPSPTWASGAFELTGSDLRMKHAHPHSKKLAHRGPVGCCHVTCHGWPAIGQASENRPDIGQHDAIWLTKARYHLEHPRLRRSHEAPRPAASDVVYPSRIQCDTCRHLPPACPPDVQPSERREHIRMELVASARGFPPTLNLVDIDV